MESKNTKVVLITIIGFIALLVVLFFPFKNNKSLIGNIFFNEKSGGKTTDIGEISFKNNTKKQL